MTAAIPAFAHLEDEVFSTSTHTMHTDLMGVIVNSCKAMPNVWQKMNQEQQQDFLDSIDSQVELIVQSCVKTIAASGKPFVLAKVDQVTFKGGIEAKLKIERDINTDGAPSGAHELADNTGELVMIILPGLGEYEAEDGEKPQAEDDQPDILDSGSDELYDDAVAFVRESDRASISALQGELRIGYNRAARLIEIMERAGIVGSLDGKGQRQVIG